MKFYFILASFVNYLSLTMNDLKSIYIKIQSNTAAAYDLK